MIIVTGSNGFIGSNLIRQLNIENETDIIAVDDHSNSDLRSNIKDCKILKTTSIDNFLSDVLSGEYDDKNIEAIFHQGACSDTMESGSSRWLAENSLLKAGSVARCLSRLAFRNTAAILLCCLRLLASANAFSKASSPFDLRLVARTRGAN